MPAVPSWIATPQGLATADTFTGTSGKDVFIGRGGDDELNGGGGDDMFSGGEGNDSLSGGADTDTAVYDGAAAHYALTVQTNAGGFVTGITAVQETTVTGTNEGADTLSGIEQVQFADVTLDLNDPVQLFDAGGKLIGTFHTIAARSALRSMARPSASRPGLTQRTSRLTIKS